MRRTRSVLPLESAGNAPVWSLSDSRAANVLKPCPGAGPGLGLNAPEPRQGKLMNLDAMRGALIGLAPLVRGAGSQNDTS